MGIKIQTNKKTNKIKQRNDNTKIHCKAIGSRFVRLPFFFGGGGGLGGGLGRGHP